MTCVSRVSGDRLAIPDVVIVVTDGQSTLEAENVMEEATALREKARVLVVGVSQRDIS